MPGNIYAGGQGPLYTVPETGSPKFDDPRSLPPELYIPGWQYYQDLLAQREALIQQGNRYGVYPAVRAEALERQGGASALRRETPLLGAAKRKKREDIELQLAAIDARLDELKLSQPYLRTLEQYQGSMEQALLADYRKNLEGGMSDAQAARIYSDASDRLKQGVSAYETDETAAGAAMAHIPIFARSAASGGFAAEGEAVQVPGQPGPPRTDTQERQSVYGDPDMDRFMALLQSGGMDFETAADTVWPMNKPPAIAAAIGRQAGGGLTGAELAEVESRTRNYAANAQGQEFANVFAEQQNNINMGVLGGVNAQGRFAPQDVGSYMDDPGWMGQVAQAQMSEMTGGPTAWQLQQWQADQSYRQQALGAEQSYRQQSLAQQAAYQQALLEQQRREMAAQIGQAVANMANQSYMNTLGQRLPAGTQYAPGFGPGGAMSQLAGMSGTNYTPTQVGVANPPTTDELMRAVQEAINRF